MPARREGRLRAWLRGWRGRARPVPEIERLVVGLGNPGPEYADTRHNVGFRIVEALARRHGIGLDDPRHAGRLGAGEVRGRRVGVFEPLTFMNRSGPAVAEVLAAFPGLDPRRDCIVVSDDLDLPTGRIRLRVRGGAGGHRGLGSLIEAIGTMELPRLRFGVGRPPDGVEVVDHVLTAFDGEEQRALAEQIDTAVDALECFVADGIDAAMDRYNAAASQGDAGAREGG